MVNTGDVIIEFPWPRDQLLPRRSLETRTERNVGTTENAMTSLLCVIVTALRRGVARRHEARPVLKKGRPRMKFTDRNKGSN